MVRDRRARIVLLSGLAAAALGLASCGSSTPTNSASPGSAGSLGPEGITLQQGQLLAPLAGAASGQAVGAVTCDPAEHVVSHIHAHLAVYVNGVLRPIPPGIGIVAPVAEPTSAGPIYAATTCYYWLHVHAQDGVIHIESPSTTTTFTLGQFFAIWGQPLDANQLATESGPVTAFVNGQRFGADPGSITLSSREDIQLDVGPTNVPPQGVDWSNSRL